MSNTNFGIALLGFGTVGSGVFDLLSRESSEIQAKYGVKFDVRKILVRNPNARRAVALPKHLIAPGMSEILTDPSVDVVVEVMGGENPAREYIVDSFKAGKHVITANKKLCGAYGEKLVERARQYGCYFGFAGSVTGFHQLCPSIVSSVMIESLSGVFNGTSNYILTRMEEGASFEDALRDAQLKGYAEADPSEDIDGLDTRNKLVIAAKLAFGVFLDREEITPNGIRHVTKQDMDFAQELGFTIKLLGTARITGEGKLYAAVAPCLIPHTDPLASVRGVYNGIQVYDALRGTQGMTASGAGSQPTAMAIFSNLVSMAKGEQTLWPGPSRIERDLRLARQQPPGSYYVRMHVHNHPGALAKITKAFGKADINITNVIQRAEGPASMVPLVIMCGPTDDRTLRQALREVEATKLLESPSLLMRVEQSLPTDTSLQPMVAAASV